MFSQNGHSTGVRISDGIDNLASNLKSVVEQMSKQAYSAKKNASSFVAKTGEIIKAHPIAAIGIAFGFGYLVIRALRR